MDATGAPAPTCRNRQPESARLRTVRWYPVRLLFTLRWLGKRRSFQPGRALRATRRPRARVWRPATREAFVLPRRDGPRTDSLFNSLAVRGPNRCLCGENPSRLLPAPAVDTNRKATRTAQERNKVHHSGQTRLSFFRAASREGRIRFLIGLKDCRQERVWVGAGRVRFRDHPRRRSLFRLPEIESNRPNARRPRT